MHRDGRGKREFLEERERLREPEREGVREVAMHVQTLFAWGQRELERKLPSHCRICTQSTKIRDISRKPLQRPIQGTTKPAQQPGNYTQHKVNSFICCSQIISQIIYTVDSTCCSSFLLTLFVGLPSEKGARPLTNLCL